MPEARHGYLTTSEGIHIPYQWSYADAATRLAAVGFVATDVGKLAFQEDDSSLWVLTAVAPTWQSIGTGYIHVTTHEPAGDDPFLSTSEINLQAIRSHIRIGATGAPGTSMVLDLTSTDGALMVPRMTTAEKNALTAANGMVVYDSTLNKFYVRENGAWTAMVAAGGALEVKEQDGAPDVNNVTIIKVTNGKLTDDGGGTISLDLSGGAGAGDDMFALAMAVAL